MAQLRGKFNPLDHDTEQRGGDPLPDGIYELEVESSKENDKNNDTYFRIDIVYDVRAPEEYKGRKIFDGFNLQHDASPKAEEIANRQFAQLCRAIGHEGECEDTEELHFRPFVAKIKTKPASKGKDGKEYGPRNEILRYYYPDEGNVPEAEVSDAPANDNKPASRRPANDNKPAPRKAAASGGKRRPWGSK